MSVCLHAGVLERWSVGLASEAEEACELVLAVLMRGSFSCTTAFSVHPACCWPPVVPCMLACLPACTGNRSPLGWWLQVTRGVMYTREEAEGKRLRHPFDTITGAMGRVRLCGCYQSLVGLMCAQPCTWGTHVPRPCSCRPRVLRPAALYSAEGIGINRLTQNFTRAQVDHAFKGTDREAVEMVRGEGSSAAGVPWTHHLHAVHHVTHMWPAEAHWQAWEAPACLARICLGNCLSLPALPCPRWQAQYLLRNEGLFVGSSAAMNCVGAVKAARRLGRGHTVVTVLCDGGHRHLSKFHSPAYLAEHGLTPAATGTSLNFVA